SLYIAASFLSRLRGSHGLAGSVGDGNSHGDPDSSLAANRLLTAGARTGTGRPVRVFVASGDNSTMNVPESSTWQSSVGLMHSSEVRSPVVACASTMSMHAARSTTRCSCVHRPRFGTS